MCPKKCPEIFHKKKVAAHLREHKYANYKCSCESQKDVDLSQTKESVIRRKRKEHLLIDHWGWRHCSHKDTKNCGVIMPESQHQIHLYRKHNEKEALR